MRVSSGAYFGNENIQLIMVDNNATIYQYYTVVSGNDSFVPTNNQFSLVNNIIVDGENARDQQQVMYLSLDNEQSYSLDVVLNSGIQSEESEDAVAADAIVVDEVEEQATSESDTGTMPNIEFVVQDGQMYMRDSTPTLEEENYTLDSELIDGLKSNPDEEIEDTPETPIKEEENEETTVFDGNHYMQVELEDGTFAYINNVKSMTRIFACPSNDCNKVYNDVRHLTVHIRSHTGNRPFECPHTGCKKAFSTNYSLKVHMRTHTGEAPYGCTVCLKHFKAKGDLLKHLRTHTGEKPFMCPMKDCGRSFRTSNIRKVHVRSHTGERPYTCTVEDCKKAFASPTNFKNHMRIHSGEKPYKCPLEYCGKCFTEYSSLYKHKSVHQPMKQFKCQYCNQKCRLESTLRVHMQTRHKELFTHDGTEVQLKEQVEGDNVPIKYWSIQLVEPC